MSSIMVPSTSGRVLAQPRPIVHINAFCTRQAPANSLFCSIQSRSKARVQHRLVKQEARRQGLTIRAAAAAEGQGFASDEGTSFMACIYHSQRTAYMLQNISQHRNGSLHLESHRSLHFPSTMPEASSACAKAVSKFSIM